MRERIKETVPEIRRRAEKDKRFLDWKPEQEETHVSGVRPEMKAEVKAVPPAGNRGLRFDEWAEENQSSRKSVSAAPLPKRAAVPSLAAGLAGIEAEDRPVSTHRSGRFGGHGDGGRRRQRPGCQGAGAVGRAQLHYRHRSRRH